MRRPKLSSSTTGQEWLEQFSEEDRPSAAAMLDTLVLLNEEQVSVAIRGLLHGLTAERKGARRRVALYAEREFPERYVFEVRHVPDAAGVVRRRAVGRSVPAAVKPVRGSARVGSEGLIAFIISTSCGGFAASLTRTSPAPTAFEVSDHRSVPLSSLPTLSAPAPESGRCWISFGTYPACAHGCLADGSSSWS